MKTIGGRFGANLFDPLYEHACKGGLCARLIRQLVEALAADDRPHCAALCAEVTALEQQADEIRAAITASLTTSIFATIKRSAVLHAIRYQDRICNQAEDAAKLVVIRHTILPGGTSKELLLLADKVVNAVESVVSNSQQLVLMSSPEEGERGKDWAIEKATLIERFEGVHREEWESDELLHGFLKELFAHEQESDPISVYVLFNVARLVGGMADAAEKAAESYVELLRE